MNNAKYLRAAFLYKTCSLYFSKIYVVVVIRYFRTLFYYLKIRPLNRTKLTIDRSTFIVKRLFNHFAFTEICSKLKLERTCGALPESMEVFLNSFTVKCFSS